MQEHSPLPVSVDLPSGRAYDIVFEPIARAGALFRMAGLSSDRALVITDSNVGPVYGTALEASLSEAGMVTDMFVAPAGEESKSMEMLCRLHDWALSLGIDRHTPVVALGGGVIGDLAGFAASTLLRGLPLVQVPTTVIAQVDSATGGKTGVNHAAGKNLIGAFHQPAFVLVDSATLGTLPERDFQSGFAEVVKHGLLSQTDLLDQLDRHWDRIGARDPHFLPGVLRNAVAIKADVVAADERETGARAYLNLGHTFGHAIEKAAGYGVYTHGEAVAIGLRAALWLSARLGGLAPTPGEALPAPFNVAERVVRRLSASDLAPTLRTDDLMEAMSADKKRAASGLRFVVLDAPGSPRLAGDIPDDVVRQAWEHARLTT